MRWLLRIGRTREDAAALAGDLEEERRARVRPARGWLAAEIWYARQVAVAAVFGLRDSLRGRSPVRGLFRMGDVRFALRRWRRRPGFAFTAALTLALGIGATTSMFSVADAVILRPLPWPEPERLVVIHGVYPDRRQDPAYATTWNRGTLTCPMWDALRRAEAFTDVAVWTPSRTRDTTFGEARTEIVSVGGISSGLLPVLGVRVVLGRNFNDEDDHEPTYAMLLPHETWQRRFGGRSDIVGEIVTMGHASSGGTDKRRVVGVLEPAFRFGGEPPEFLWNVGTAGEVCRTYDGGSFRAVARLAPGASVESAAVEAQGLVGALQRKETTSVRLVPLVEEELGAAARPLWLLLGGAGLLLLVACANVVGLLLGEGRHRRHEVGVRLALGGSRPRVIRQLVVEHALLALVGSVAGLVLAVWITQTLVGIAPASLPRIDTVAVDWRVAAVALALGAAALLISGVAPAWSLARTDAAGVLAEGGRGWASGRHLGHRAIVAAEIAIALVLVVGAALFGETIARLASQPLGFNPANLTIVSTSFTGSRLGDPAVLRAAQGRPDFRDLVSQLMLSTSTARTEALVTRLRALPGVQDVAGASAIPFLASPSFLDVRIEGRSSEPVQRVRQQVVTDGYFATMGMPVVEGRGFADSDRPGDPRAAVVSAEFSRRFFDGRAIGQRFSNQWAPDRISTYEIIGVVPDVKRVNLAENDEPLFYALDRQLGLVSYIVVRSSIDPVSTIAAVRQAIAEVDPQVVVTATTTMSELIGGTVAEERFRAMLSACFGGAGLLLAAVGLYGLSARRVVERRKEFGVRVALGAAPVDLRALVLRDAAVIVGAGLLVGLPAAFAASQVTRALLFGVTPTAPHVFLIAAGVLGLAALAAMLAPVRRAGQLDPVVALRE
jgi:predicted permease